jgi:hypothetical protein
VAAIAAMPLMTFERAHAAESETTRDVMVSKSMIDNFFITAHPAIVAAFTLKMPDDRHCKCDAVTLRIGERGQ